MATLTINPVEVASARSVCPTGTFLVSGHTDARVVQFGFDATNLRSIGSFEVQTESGRGVMMLHTYALESIGMRLANKTEPWNHNRLVGEQFAELSIPVVFRDRTQGRLILMQWTTARLASLVAPRPFGLPVRSATIATQTTDDAETLTIREEGNGSEITLQFPGSGGADWVTPNPWLVDRPRALTLTGTTVRGHASEISDAKALDTPARLVNGSLIAQVLPGVDSLNLIDAQRMSPYVVYTSLPLCLNGSACGLSWNELKTESC